MMQPYPRRLRQGIDDFQLSALLARVAPHLNPGLLVGGTLCTLKSQKYQRSIDDSRGAKPIAGRILNALHFVPEVVFVAF
jgi:hypothetical protein